MQSASEFQHAIVSAQGTEADVLAAVNAVREQHGLALRSAELMRWRADAPDGAVLGVARDAERVVAVVQGVRHRVLLEGQPTHWVEVVELCNDFAGRTGLARTRAYLELCEAFAREVGGFAPEAANVLYGIPNRRAHRIGLARLKQEILRSENVLSVQPSTVVWEHQGLEVEELARFDERVDAFFERFAQGRPAIAVRDVERLNWRYADHPERDYRCALVKRGEEILGYAVLREGSWGGHEGGLLVDWLVLPEREAWFELLVWARDASARDRLVVNVGDKSPEFGLFQAFGFRVAGTDEYLVFRGFQKPYVMSWLSAHWTYTLGDSERG